MLRGQAESFMVPSMPTKLKAKGRHRGNAKDLSSAALRYIRDYAHANPGTIQRISDIISKYSTERVSRQMVSRWLAEDPTKRVQPTHGYAILLNQAMAILQEEDQRIQQEQQKRK